jgi:hypothetical protein
MSKPARPEPAREPVVRAGRPARSDVDTGGQPQVAGRTGAVPVATVRLPVLPGALADPTLGPTQPSQPSIVGRRRPVRRTGQHAEPSVVPAARPDGFPGDPAASGPGSPPATETDLGGRRRGRRRRAVLLPDIGDLAALAGRAGAPVLSPPPDSTLRRQRGATRPAGQQRPDEEVWVTGNPAAPVVDTPAAPATEQAPTPALGRA